MIRKFARPMLASIFVWDGVDMLRNTSDHVAETESVLKRLRKVTPKQYAGYIPNDPELVTRALGGVKTGAAATFATGKAPRTSAALLAISHIPSLLGNAFWEEGTSEEKAERRQGFLTDTALLGALTILTQDTEGKPSLRWRTAKASQRANKKIQQALPSKSEQSKFADELSSRANDFSSEVSAKANDWFETAKDYVQDAKEYVEDNREDWESAGREFFDNARDFVEDAVEDARDFFESNKDDWLKAARDNAETARKGAVKAAAKAQDRADIALNKVDAATNKRTAKKARKKAEKLQKQATKKLDKAFNKFGDKLD
ncbi:DoxX family protein [Corynebacterium sp.]|uniref:DoxX family protein n=1 Tax=Corynebacterium sp. TaxID=1720 RepID=UPI0026DC574E|nr:DoxX family protein [Corynebacterium sp.]MDO5031800.1 DoxX family protein [Corynebacterium sp.]